MISHEDIRDPVAALAAVPLDRLGLADRSLAALLTAGLLTIGDLRRFGEASPGHRDFPGLDRAESVAVIRAAMVYSVAWARDWHARQRAALHAEIAAGCREAEAARESEGSP